MVSPDDRQQQKAKLDEIIARAATDPSFKRRIQDDPVPVLRKEGLSDDLIGDVVRDEGGASIDPNAPNLSRRQRELVDIARRGCWFTCVTTDTCAITITF
jgi:hypothetical protein